MIRLPPRSTGTASLLPSTTLCLSLARAAGELCIAPPTIARPEEPGPRGPTAGDVEAAQDMTPEEREAFIRSMVDQLAARLEAEPADPDGWLRLARAYRDPKSVV